jgi:hypothetical protein
MGWEGGGGEEIKRKCFRVALRWAALVQAERERECVCVCVCVVVYISLGLILLVWSGLVWSGLVALQRVGWARGIDYTASGCYTVIYSTFYLVPLVLILGAGCG